MQFYSDYAKIYASTLVFIGTLAMFLAGMVFVHDVDLFIICSLIIN